jgi:hypothetical protein
VPVNPDLGSKQQLGRRQPDHHRTARPFAAFASARTASASRNLSIV